MKSSLLKEKSKPLKWKFGAKIGEESRMGTGKSIGCGERDRK